MLYQKHLSKAQHIYHEHTCARACTQSNTQEEISSKLKQARVTTVTDILTTITLTSGVLHKHETKSSTTTAATTRETQYWGVGAMESSTGSEQYSAFSSYMDPDPRAVTTYDT